MAIWPIFWLFLFLKLDSHGCIPWGVTMDTEGKVLQNFSNQLKPKTLSNFNQNEEFRDS